MWMCVYMCDIPYVCLLVVAQPKSVPISLQQLIGQPENEMAALQSLQADQFSFSLFFLSFFVVSKAKTKIKLHLFQI